MSHLTERQLQVLKDLVEGTTVQGAGRSLRALERRGLVNRDGYPTTSGWHAVGRMRYVPEVRVPQNWEIDTWRGKALYVEEGPEQEYDDEGNPRGHIAHHASYWLDIYKMMKFYQACKLREKKILQDMWTTHDDYKYEGEIKHGWRGGLGASAFVTRSVMEAKNKANAEVELEWDIFYTADYYYRWANDLFLLLDTGKSHRHMDCSYKYSLQDNLDEVKKFQLSKPVETVDQFLYMASVTVS